VKTMKYGQQAIGEETDLHVKLLEQTDKEVERTTAHMIVVDNKLKSFLKKSNMCCLWVIIVTQLVVIGFLVWQLIT